MPEFVMESAGTVTLHGRPFAFADLCDFTQGYLEALFFTSCDPSAPMTKIGPDHEFSDGSIPADVGFSDLHPDSLARVIEDCAAFELGNAANLAAAKELQPGGDGFRYGRDALDGRRLGQLFHYASQGHGIGCTDDGDASCLVALQEAARDWRRWERSISWGAAADGPESPTGYGFVFVE